MTVKQYANELYDRFYAIIFERGEEMSQEVVVSLLAKECAKQAVKELYKHDYIYYSLVMKELNKIE